MAPKKEIIIKKAARQYRRFCQELLKYGKLFIEESNGGR